MKDGEGDKSDKGQTEAKNEGKAPDENTAVYPRHVDVMLSETPERDAGQMGKAQASEKLTEVHDGLSLIMQAVKRGSVPTVEAVFTAMVSALDDDQLTRAFAGGTPSRNLPLLFLAAERGGRDVFDTVLGVLHRVAKVARNIDKGPLDLNEHSDGRWIPTDLHGKAEGRAPGDLTLLQAVYSENRSAVQTWIQRTKNSTRRAEELLRFHAGRTAVMHAALVGPPGIVPGLLDVMRELSMPSESVEVALENRASKASLLLSAAEGGNRDVFNEILGHESGKRLLDLFLGGYEYGRATLLDAALNEGPTSFRAVAEILDKELDEDEAISMLRNSSFDGRDDDDLRAYGVPERLVVAARVAALSHVLSSDQMADLSTVCLQAELHGMDKSLLPRDNRGDHWLGRLSFLLACGAKVSSGADGNLGEISDSLGFDHLEKCLKEAISIVDNPFIPGMMLALSLAMEAPNAKENERRKMNELREMVEELLLEVLERLPQTVQGFPGGATACSVLFEPETTETRSDSFKGPLKIAFSKHLLVTTFCTQPLIVDFISHTFSAGLLNLPARMPSDRFTPAVAAGVLKKIDPAVIAKGLLEERLQQNRATLYPGAQFILVGLVAMPFTYYRVPLLRMCLDFAVFLILIFVYTLVVSNMYDTTIANGPEIALGFYVVAAIIAEANALRKSNPEYFRDHWKWLDVPALFLLSVGFVVRLSNAASSDASGRVGEALYLLAAPLLFSRILFFGQIHPSLGALIQVMIRMVGKVFQFSIILIIVMMGFVVSFWASTERFVGEAETESFEVMWVAVFKAMLGDFEDIEGLTPDPDWVDRVVFVFYLVVMTVMLLNLLIAVLTTAHANIEERADMEIIASKVRTMEHYRTVVVNDVLPPPLNLFQLLALIPIWMIDLCGGRGLYARLKPTIGRIMGSFVFWVTSGPVAIILGSLLWYASIPTAVINQWDQKKRLWDNLLGSLAILLEHLIVVPLALTWLWALGAMTSARQIMNLARGIRLTASTLISFSSGTLRVQSSVGEILMRTGDGLGVHQLSLCLEDPMSDPMVRRDEETRPTTVKHIKLLRNRLEETDAARVDNLLERIESALKAKEETLEDKITAAITSAVDEKVNELQKVIQSKIDAVLEKLETSRA